VGALALRSCIKGSFLNIKINASVIDDKDYVREIFIKGCDIDTKSNMEEEAILKMVEEKIDKVLNVQKDQTINNPPHNQ
jgi:formiminotetrahydrofolate cyclodeaminase